MGGYEGDGELSWSLGLSGSFELSANSGRRWLEKPLRLREWFYMVMMVRSQERRHE